jgi:hypothetical protein
VSSLTEKKHAGEVLAQGLFGGVKPSDPELMFCPLIQVNCPTPQVSETSGVLSVAEAMLEECNIEARFSTPEDAMMVLSKRDALSELVGRLKHGRRNSAWARLRPAVTVGL